MTLLLLACAAPESPAPLSLQVSLESTQVDSGEPIVLHACVRSEAQGWSWQPSFPGVSGLEMGEVQVQVDGPVSCMDVPYLGADGSYILDPVLLSAQGPDRQLELRGPRLFADIGVAGPSSDLGGLREAPAAPDRRWIWRLVAVLVAALGGIASMIWRAREKAPAPAQVVAPSAAALAEWQRVLADPDLGDHQRAMALSAITRRYLQHVGAPDAPNRTTSELLLAARGHVVLGQWVGVLTELLGAADEIKFAGGVGSQQLFERWSQGLAELVQGTWRRRGVLAQQAELKAPSKALGTTESAEQDPGS